MSVSATADAINATERLRDAFSAETLSQTKIIDPSLPEAIKVEHAYFSWDGVPPDSDANKKLKHSKFASTAPLQSQTPEVAEHTFQLSDINLSIPRGQLCAIVGPVGSGKSSLLQGMIGEMRCEAGTVGFGGSVGYCQQSAWIQVCVKRDEFFSKVDPNNRMRPFERIFVSGVRLRRSGWVLLISLLSFSHAVPYKYWEAVRDSCLEPDLEMLPHGDATEVGERVCRIPLAPDNYF